MAKYVKVKSKYGIYEIIVFSETILHSTFKDLEPVSAGFISFTTRADGKIDCICLGQSTSLGLSADEDDSKLARIQIVGF